MLFRFQWIVRNHKLESAHWVKWPTIRIYMHGSLCAAVAGNLQICTCTHMHAPIWLSAQHGALIKWESGDSVGAAQAATMQWRVPKSPLR